MSQQKMGWYPWLNTTYRKILDSYRMQKGHHFLLIQSKRDNGEDSLIYALSRWLMCFKPIGNKSCNQCHGCYLMRSGCHPDYYSLVPELNSHSIGVDSVRVLVEKLYRHAYIANVKVVYIKNSLWLTEEAVNALLKIFEEPPGGVYFFLGCKDGSRLLPTFLSRCLCWVLSSPEEEASVSWLYTQGITNSINAITALRLSDGAPLEASFILKSDYWQFRLELCKELKNSVNNGDFLNILPFFKNHKCKDKLLVSWLCSFLIDSLKYHYRVYDFLVNIDQIDLIRCMVFKFSLLVLSNQLQQWLICLYHWDKILYMNQELLLAYQLLNVEDNVMSFTYY